MSPLTIESRRRLFKWKNGSVLSKRKIESIKENYPIPGDPSQLSEYLSPNRRGGPIWNIFYMHCVNPAEWPIFDQHSFRAMHFVQTGEIKELCRKRPEILLTYKNQYVPFIKDLGSAQRKIDKALYSFGRFLKMAKSYN